MSARYEWAGADGLPIAAVGPGTQLGERSTDAAAVVLGDPWASALVIEGSPADLQALVARIGAAIGQGAARLVSELRADVAASSTMEHADRDYVTECLDDIATQLAGMSVSREERTIWRLMAADLDGYAGRLLSDGELMRIAQAIGHSVPEAIDTVVNAEGFCTEVSCRNCGKASPKR